jgi:hypothetical protein
VPGARVFLLEFTHLLPQQASHIGAHREGLGCFIKKSTDISHFKKTKSLSSENELHILVFKQKFHLRPVRRGNREQNRLIHKGIALASQNLVDKQETLLERAKYQSHPVISGPVLKSLLYNEYRVECQLVDCE